MRRERLNSFKSCGESPIVDIDPVFYRVDGRMAIKVEVLLTNRTINWPFKCACCGGPPETAIEIEYTRQVGHSERVYRYLVPACTVCSIHSVPKRTRLLLFFWVSIAGVLIFTEVRAKWDGRAGWFFFAWFAVQLFLFIKFWVKEADRKARETMTPTCTAKSFVFFMRNVPFTWFKSLPVSDIFWFQNDDYGRAFSELNQGVLLKPEAKP